jgi:predicted GNAT family N-acyltransferase
MKSFLHFIEEHDEHEKAFSNLKTHLDDANISHSISHNKKSNTISVNKIVVNKENRNKGVGSSAMKAITSHADKYKKRIELTPSSDFGGNKSRLVSFYKKHGFIENKGKHKDYSISHTMYREPNK